MSDKIKVIKIGGNVVDDPESLQKFIADFCKQTGPTILVHGGGKEATRLSGALGIETVKIDGRRVTDSTTLDVVTMVYAGLVNKRIVALLQSNGVNALGLTGADANIIRASRRPPIPIDFGFVGDITPSDVNTKGLCAMIKSGLTPVICSIMHDGRGTLLNCNADTVAATVAMAMTEEYDADLIYCFERNGVLKDPTDDSSVIDKITPDEYRRLVEEKIVADGMLPKLSTAMKAVEYGVKEVVIKNASDLLISAGTTITI